MNVLYVTGSCLNKNTSANMSHNAFVKGLLDCGCNVDIIMASNSWGEQDNALPNWQDANYYTYESESLIDRLRKKGRKTITVQVTGTEDNINDEKSHHKINFKQNIRKIIKNIFYFLFPNDPIYPLERTWLKKAKKFNGNKTYDLIISNSSPAASHKLVSLLKDNNRVCFKRWIQIWEDPWFYDLYGNSNLKIKDEEAALLSETSEIYYVSPLTMMYQKKYFPESALKMKCIPLPYFELKKECINKEMQVISNSYGYFGDFYSTTRNLYPFYQALEKSGYTGFIFGDSDLSLKSTDKIQISRRVTLDKLSSIQDKTEVLVHLCNLKGGQIPGKIYHYSATTKKILFILDGTEEEQEFLYKFFSKFNRFYFCKNNKESILETMRAITLGDSSISNQTVIDFAPKNVVQTIIDKKSLL